jgi:hypothetical protein
MPWHQFFILDAERFRSSDYLQFVRDLPQDTVRLSHDVCMYMSDTLEWIPSRNPANEAEWPGYGLNLYGPTVVSSEGAMIAEQVFSAWAQLFAAAPTRFSLVQGWERVQDGSEGRIRRFHVEREETVEALRQLADLARTVTHGEHFLLHLGI